VKLDAAYVRRIADATGFDAVQLEKVIRLRQVLIEFRKHPFLQKRLVLKGGTAINLFYLELARLSVDIDLNYIGQLDREAMQRERPEIIKATEQVSLGSDTKCRVALRTMLLTNGFSHTKTTPALPTKFKSRLTF
jgi:predicted nucleotidyltransferase component of viral defense system